MFYRPLIIHQELSRPIDWKHQFGRRAPLGVEIGFGMGEFLIRTAKDNPDRDYVGLEENWERIYKTLKRVAQNQKRVDLKEEQPNIRILKVDARVAFERLFVPKSIEQIYCLFPCPWPKKGHIKHRLFSKDFFKLLNSRLKPKGRLRITTDSIPFFDWILDQTKGTGFTVKTARTRPKYDTKFERKWQELGQEEFFEMDMLKERHIKVGLKEDVLLKAYTLKEFDAAGFEFKDVTGDPSVIFKEKVFDARRKKAMIHVVVAEEHLTQHFWVTIAKRNDKWYVLKTDGQSFLPTPGINKALELVYKAAKET